MFLARRTTQFYLGLACLVLGLLLRSIESATLTPTASRLLTSSISTGDELSRGTARPMVLDGGSGRKTIQPPTWWGWCLLSVGAVLLAAAALPRGSK